MRLAQSGVATMALGGLIVMAQLGSSAAAAVHHVDSSAELLATKQGALPAVSQPFCSANGLSWCMWSGTDATGTQLGPEEGNIANLGSIGWRNIDESVENDAEPYGEYLRLYYSPNYGGAWVCLNVGTYIQNTANHSFNNGSNLAGYGATLYRNVASVSFSDTKCTNATG